MMASLLFWAATSVLAATVAAGPLLAVAAVVHEVTPAYLEWRDKRREMRSAA